MTRKLFSSYYIVVVWGGITLHLYTIYVAYLLSGFIGAIATAFLTPFSNIYWLYGCWSAYGSVYNFYTQVFCVYIVVASAYALIMFTADKLKVED